jgi:hypothetical protein
VRTMCNLRCELHRHLAEAPGRPCEFSCSKHDITGRLSVILGANYIDIRQGLLGGPVSSPVVSMI